MFKDTIKQLIVFGGQLRPSIPKQLRAIVMIDYKYPEEICSQGWQLCFSSISGDCRYFVTCSVLSSFSEMQASFVVNYSMPISPMF